jgi:hypothetical protein
VSSMPSGGPPYYPPYPPPQPAGSVAGTLFGLATLLGGLLVVAGSFMPWLTASAPFAGTISRSGVDGGGDGVITLIIGVLAVTIGGVRLLSQRVPRVVQHLPVTFGLLAIWTGFYDLDAVQEMAAELSANENTSAMTGPGLYTIITGGFLVTIGGFVSHRRRPPAPPPVYRPPLGTPPVPPPVLRPHPPGPPPGWPGRER